MDVAQLLQILTMGEDSGCINRMTQHNHRMANQFKATIWRTESSGIATEAIS